MITTIKAIAFDYDGTLVRTQHLHEDAWNLVFAASGMCQVRPEEICGISVEQFLAERLVPEEQRKELAAAKAAAFLGLAAAKPPELYPGVIETLLELRKRYEIGIVTVCEKELLEAQQRWIPELFCLMNPIIHEGHFARPKPEPDPYLEFAKRLGVQPFEVMAVEDSPSGVISATRAGSHILALGHTTAYDRLTDAYDQHQNGTVFHHVDTFREITKVI